MSNPMSECAYFPKCTGCSSWNLPYQQQKSMKISYLQSLLKAHNLDFKPDIDFISCGEHSLRHRVDFTIGYNSEINQHQFGFYDAEKKLLDIKQCLQLAPELQLIYSEFIKNKFYYGNIPVKKGSIRLRVGPNGIKGCWLDFSNIEIKQLLEDQKLLGELLHAGYIVEVGQKGKRLIRKNNLLKLDEPKSEIWFETIDSNQHCLNLKCLISDFTQPSWISAKKIVQVVLDSIKKLPDIKNVLEFGAGIGQFTLSFMRQNFNVEVCEISESAVMQLNLNAQEYNLKDKLITCIGDFHKKKITQDKSFDLIFVNPSRSGLKNFIDEIMLSGADYLAYVSCFPDTMISDLEKLSKKYIACNIIIIDQFPQTKHFETYIFLKKLS